MPFMNRSEAFDMSEAIYFDLLKATNTFDDNEVSSQAGSKTIESLNEVAGV